MIVSLWCFGLSDGIKSIVDTDKTPLITFMYLMLLVSWAYTRLFVLPCHLIYAAIRHLSHNHLDVVVVFVLPMIAMLCILVVLHVYWYFLFIVMGYTLVKKGVAEDIQHAVGSPTEAAGGESASAMTSRRDCKND